VTDYHKKLKKDEKIWTAITYFELQSSSIITPVDKLKTMEKQLEMITGQQ